MIKVTQNDVIGCRVIEERELHAGGNWSNGTNCRSQCQNANNYRWNTNSNISCQFCADTGECGAKPTPG